MTCPFTAHIERHSAAKAGGSAHAQPGAIPLAENGPAASEYELKRVELGEDLRQLSNTQSLQRKIEMKGGMIERYRDWIAGALSAETPAQDDIVTTMLVWSIDIADWPLALELARHVLTHRLALPERYKRDPAVLIAEEFAEAAFGETPNIDLDTLQEAEALTALADMPDEVRAKVQKAIGLAFKAKADTFDPSAESGVAGGKAALIAAALSHLQRAVALNDKCGVKKIITSLQAEAKRVEEGKAA